MIDMGLQRTVWQISGGPTSRSYTDVFLKYSVGLIGPGDAGEWRADRDDTEFEGGFIRRFVTEVQVGDVFLLRTGISKIAAVGLVASDYLYLNQFDDVNGWDLQHARRIRWCKLPEDYDFGRQIFGANPTRLGRTWDQEVTDYAERFLNSPPTHWQTAPLPEPTAEEPMLAEIPRYLQGVVAEVNDLAPLYWQRENFGDHPSEDELVAHFIIPFLRSLGWPPEWIGVKWRYVDVAVFKALPRAPENCQFVIEAKRLGEGVEGALGQAKRYVEELGLSCDIVVTDGIRYRMYSWQQDFVPKAYANLARLKRSATESFSRMKRP